MPSLLLKLLPLLLILTLAACGDDSDSDSSPDTGGGGGGEPVTGSSGLGIGTGSGIEFLEGKIEAGSSTLSEGGNTLLTVNIVDLNDDNILFTQEPVSVTFTSQCLNATDPESILDGPLERSTNNGTVSVRYEAESCVDTDTVTATAELNGKPIGQANIVLSIVERTQAGSLSASTPVPMSLSPINLQSENRRSESNVVFTVRDRAGNRVDAGQLVTFSLNQQIEGELAESVPRLVRSSDTTDASGEVVAQVEAGTNNAVVIVTATVTLDGGKAISTSSQQISVNEQLPVQTSLSVAAENFKPNAWFLDGERVSITVRAADRNGVAVSGAVVNFVTNGGAIEGDCILEDGECSVEWRSQNPRPADGRVTILARTVGEDSFKGSGDFQEGYDLEDQRGEPFLDISWTRNFDSAEDVFFDQNNNDVWDGPDGVYVGSACPMGADFCRRDTKSIWSNLTGLWMTSDILDIEFVAGTEDNQFCARVSGIIPGDRSTPPPVGTTILFTASDGAILADPDNSDFEVDNRAIGNRDQPYVKECVIASGDGTLTVRAEGETSRPFSRSTDVGTGP